MSESVAKSKKADALRVLRDFSQTHIDTLDNDDRQTLLEAILGVPAATATVATAKRRKRKDKIDDGETTPRDVRKRLERSGSGGEEKECPGAPVANRRRMHIPLHVVNLFPDQDDLGVAN